MRCYDEADGAEPMFDRRECFARRARGVDELSGVFSLIEKSRRPLLIIAEEVAPPVIMMLLSRREKDNFKVAAIHPPEYGHWRKAMLDDIAITTGGKVISRDLGGAVERARLEDLGSARQVRISSTKTLITAGNGRPKEIQARREQVSRQFDAAPENIERDKFQERLAKLSGGTAMILGSVLASFSVEDFSLDRFRRLDVGQIRERFAVFVQRSA